MKRVNPDNVGKNKTKEYYFKMCKIFYALGAPNYWYTDLGIPEYVATIHDILVWIADLVTYAYLLSLFGANFTQHNLSAKQKNDMGIFTMQPFWIMYILVFSYYRKEVRVLGYELAVKLKKEYNDPEVEEEMIQSIKIYAGTFVFFGASMVVVFGLQGFLDVILNGNNFVTVIPIWPDIHDDSTIAGVARVALYVEWMIFFIRVCSTSYVEAIIITSSVSHHYKNLCSYYRSLSAIFEDPDTTQEEKEYTYQEAFIIGIDYHNRILRCKKLTEKICLVLFSNQIFINLASISLLLINLVHSERTLTNLMTTFISMICILVATGCLWCSAGDITVEASHLSTAMFESGWQHCRGRAALRARTLLCIAMWHSQRPVELQCLGLVKISYSSYVMIVRMSYQVFSVLYSQ